MILASADISGWACLLAPFIALAVLVTLITLFNYFEPRYEYKYQYGQHDFSPLVGTMLVLVRKRDDGSWLTLRSFTNTRTNTKVGRRHYECHFQYPSEMEWKMAAVEVARCELAKDKCEYQDIRVSYRAYHSGEVVLWQNGVWR